MDTENNIDQILCQNCENEHDIEFNFCPHCGQQTKEDLTVSVLFYNTISNYFSFDARFLRSFIPLMFKPGFIAKKFVRGKRLTYLHPAQYYLFVSVIFFFLLSFKVREYSQAADEALQKTFDLEQKEDLNLKLIDTAEVAKFSETLQQSNVVTGMSEEELATLDSIMVEGAKVPINTNFNMFGIDGKKLDSLIATGATEKEQLAFIGMKEDAGFLNKTFHKQRLKFHKNKGVGIVQVFFDTIPIALFILLPIFAMIMKLLFWRKGRFAHHLVFSFYYFSFLFVVLGIILGVNYIWDVPDWIDFLVLLSTSFYLWLSMKNFYEQGYFVTFIKTGIAMFLYTSFILPTALLIIALGSFIFY